ncbi:MAG: FtsW/RodA/SpoVE family cell cycle protein [Christensenellaceae bacterium]|nr:FtsW/RodA/SpoVE family cell cycle protein [Christensenellaceae bacterium]
MDDKVVSLQERRRARQQREYGRRGEEPRRRTPRSSAPQPKVRKEVRYKNTFDYPMIVTLVLLVCFGLLMVYSASYYMAELRNDDADYYFFKQLLCVGIGTGFTLFFMFFDYHNYIAFPWKGEGKKIPLYWLALVFGLICLVLVYSPIGIDLNGSRRWINVGISIQPSEIMKMALIIFLSCSIGKDPRRIRQLGPGLVPYLALLVLVFGIIYFQPNFSAIVCIAALAMCMFLVGGARLPHLGAIIGVCVLALLVLVSLEGYRTDRLDALSDPMSNWQVKQSLYSIGSGGMFGRGFGNSMQKLLYLPYRESDFIFAIIAEELGFVGCIGLLVLFAVLIWRGVVVAMRAPDLTGMLLATGAVAMIAIQVIVNIGVNINILPPTGVVLPFVSYGGSGVIIFMCMVGIMLNVSRQSAPVVPVAEKGSVRVERKARPARSESEQPSKRRSRDRDWDV